MFLVRYKATTLVIKNTAPWTQVHYISQNILKNEEYAIVSTYGLGLWVHMKQSNGGLIQNVQYFITSFCASRYQAPSQLLPRPVQGCQNQSHTMPVYPQSNPVLVRGPWGIWLTQSSPQLKLRSLYYQQLWIHMLESLHIKQSYTSILSNEKPDSKLHEVVF